jgi:hypothetical protein
VRSRRASSPTFSTVSKSSTDGVFPILA